MAHATPEKQIPLVDGWIDLGNARVYRGQAPIPLTRIEASLLRYLADRRGETVSREELLAEVWGYRTAVRTRTLDTTVGRLRRKIEQNPSEPAHLHSVYGRGVRFTPLDNHERPERPKTTFFGRQRELAAIEEALASSRHVALCGPQGAGKTRLLLEALQGRVDVLWVSCHRETAIEIDVSRALGVGAAADIGKILSIRSRESSLLLVLDDLSSSDESREKVVAWTEIAPLLKVVATCPWRLGVPHETCIDVGPLSPDEAGALFVERARAARPEIEQVPEIGAITEALDRLPLGIEIAAALARLLPLGEIASHLRTAPRTAAAVTWALRQLPAHARAALERLALFEGPFVLDDVAALPTDAPIAILETLIDRHLVRFDGARYTVYESVRASLRVEEPPREAVLWHADRISLVAERDIEALRERAERWDLVRARMPDLLAAIRRTAEREPAIAGQCAIVALSCLLYDGPVRQGLALADDLIRRDLGAALGPTLVLRALLLWTAAEPLAAIDALGSTLPLLTDPVWIVRARCARAQLRFVRGDMGGFAEDLDLPEELLAAAGPRARAIVLQYRGEGETDEVRGPLWARALEGFRREGCLASEGTLLIRMGAFARDRGQIVEAIALNRRALAAMRGAPLHSRRVIAYIQAALAHRERGDLQEAESCADNAAMFNLKFGSDLHAQFIEIERARVDVARAKYQEAERRAEDLLTRDLSAELSAWAEGIRAECIEARGDLDLARHASQRAIARAIEARFPSVEAHQRATAAIIEARRGEIAAARELLAGARLLPTVDVSKMLWLKIAAVELLAEAYGGRRPEAHALEAIERELTSCGYLPASEPARLLARVRALG